MTVTINGMNTENTFDLSTGTLGTPATPAAITPRTVTDGKEYDAIILPGKYSDGAVTVEFTINPNTKPETFTWNAGDIDFTGGKQYTYEVKLTRTGVQVTGTIAEWKVEDKGDVTAD